jgi:hypothetical protein
MTLAAGKVWSKVLELLTPDSVWEVKTGNVVATIRGTAFGVSYFNGQSHIIVSEDKVETSAIDPETGEKIPGTETALSANQFSSIKNEDIPQIKISRKLKVSDLKEAPAEIREWFERNREEDVKFEEKFGKLMELREVGTIREEAPIQTPSQEQSPLQKPQPEEIAVKPEKLTVETVGNLAKITERDRIEFSAILIMSDGAKKNITAEAKWHVIGPIGRIISPGVFEAALAPEVSELGTAPGRIAATWKDPASGQELIGATEIFNVEAKIPEILPTEG